MAEEPVKVNEMSHPLYTDDSCIYLATLNIFMWLEEDEDGLILQSRPWVGIPKPYVSFSALSQNLFVTLGK